MKKTYLTLLAFGFILFNVSLLAKDAFGLIHVADLSAMMDRKDSKLTVLDANNEKTRKQSGSIPGAKLLSSDDKFDVQKELPADKTSKLVFYCANTQCMASQG